MLEHRKKLITLIRSDNSFSVQKSQQSWTGRNQREESTIKINKKQNKRIIALITISELLDCDVEEEGGWPEFPA